MNTSNKKILQVTYPFITSYPHHANLLSMLSHDEKNLEWFYNYYPQLVANYEGDNRFDFNISYSIKPFIVNCPNISTNALSRLLISNTFESFSKLAVHCINLGYYMRFSIDKYYIEEYEEHYHKIHESHSILVFGFDNNRKIFNVADFFTHGKYKFTTCSFSNIEEAYNAVKKNDFCNGVTLFKERYARKYNFDVKSFKVHLEEYIKSTNSNLKMPFMNPHINESYGKFVYGIDTYKALKSHINKCILDNNFDDIRPYHVLVDHKEYLKKLVGFLSGKGYLLDHDYYYECFDLLSKKVLILRNLFIKFNINKNKKIIDKILLLIDEIVVFEKQCMQEFYDSITDEPIINN